MELLQIENKGENIVMSKVAQYPLGVRIMWSKLIDERIIAVTSDGHLMVLECQPPFSRLFGRPICSGISPSQIPVAYFALSLDYKTLVCSGFTANITIVALNDGGEPEVVEASLNVDGTSDLIVLGIQPTSIPTEFLLLGAVMNSKEKVLVKFSVAHGAYRVIERRSLRASDVSSFVSVFVGDVGRTLLIGETCILSDDEEVSAPVRSRVHSFVPLSGARLLLQLVDKSIWILNVDDMSLTAKGSLPLVTEFCFLENSQLFCISEGCAPFLLPFLDNPQEMLSYRDASRVSLPLTPWVTNGVMTENRELAIVFAGQSQSGVTIMKNSVPVRRQYFEEPSNIFADNIGSLGFAKPRFVNDTVSLFTVGDDNLVVSTSENSGVLLGHVDNLLEVTTLAAGPFFDDFVQVTRAGVKMLHSGKEWRGSDDIIAAAVSEECCVVCLQNSHVILFGEELEVLVDREIGVVLAIAFCGDVLAVALEQQGNCSSMILYTMQLLPTNIEAHFTSPICRMLYYAPDCELFISTLAGNVSKWFLNSGEDMSLNSCEMYSSSVPASLLSFGDYVLVIGEKCLLVNEDNLMAINLGDPLAVCTQGQDSLWVLTKKHELFLYTVEEFDSDMTMSLFRCSGRPRKVISLEDGIVALCRARTHTGYRSSIDFIKDDNVIVREITSNDGIITAMKLPQPNHFVVGAATPDADEHGLLMFFSIEGETIKEHQTIRIAKPPHAMAIINNYLLVGGGRRLRYLRYDGEQWLESEQDESLASVHTQIAFLEVRGHFVWLGDRTQSVLCFSHGSKDGRLAIIPQAVDTRPRQLTAMKCIDDFTVAVGDRYGCVTILKLPEDVQVQSLWKMSPPPDRGVFMPSTVGHLVRIASFNCYQCVTSLVDTGKSLYYTTLLGQIGALVPLQDDQEYSFLSNAENAISKTCQKHFGFTRLRRIENGKVSVVDGDILETIDTLPPESVDELEGIPKLQLVGVLTKLKASAKF